MILVWITQDKRHVPVQAMTRAHIHNTINMIRSGRMAQRGRTNCNGFTNAEWVQILEAELTRRITRGINS